MAWVIDNSHTTIEFAVKHMMITTVRGRFTEFSGTVDINEEKPELSSAEGVVKTASLDTHDANRDAHLRSGDFFESEKYPNMAFRSTKITRKGADRYEVTGDLTVRNITHPVVFEVTDEGKNKDPWGNLRQGLSAQATINRKDWGLTWNVTLETGGWLVADQVKINAELQLIYQPEAQPEQAALETAAA